MAENKFSDFGISAKTNAFTGDKIHIDRLVNREIIVHRFEIKPSDFKGMCLYLQISINEIKYIVFTGSKNLQYMIQAVQPEKFPFKTTILKEDLIYSFT